MKNLKYLFLWYAIFSVMTQTVFSDNNINFDSYQNNDDDSYREIRSIQKKESDDLKFQQIAFFGHNNFFLGATKFPAGNAKDDFALARAHVNRVDGDWNLALQPLAPNADVTINNTKVATASPCNAKSITNLIVDDNNRLAVTIKIPAGGANKTKDTIFLMTDTKDGKKLYSNVAHKVQDGAGVELAADQNYTALTASGDTVFVAVPPSGKDFGKKNSGIVRLKIQNDALENYSFDNVPDFKEEKAYQILLNAHDSSGPGYYGSSQSVNISAGNFFAPNHLENVIIGEKICMHWDDVLKRLYIGLNNVTSSEKKSGAVVSLLVGDIRPDNTMIIKPAINLGRADTTPIFELNTINNIIGFKVDNVASVKASINKIRTMHTSTGKAYVIVNGDVTAKADIKTVNTKLYSLPLVKKDPIDVTTGFIAQINSNEIIDAMTVNEAKNQIVTTNFAYTLIGQSYDFISNNGEQLFTDIKIIGDTVYVSVAETRDADHLVESGIFASTALFKDNGAIESWTPWQRVAGCTDAVAGFGLDQNSGNFWYLTTADGKFPGDMTTVKVTQWGRGDASINGIHSGKPLSKVLSNFGPVYGMYSFDGDTPGFKKPFNEHDQCTMMIATGNEKIALIQSGLVDEVGIFQPTKKFFASEKFLLSDNVFLFNDQALKNLGAITVAEVARFSVDAGNGQENKGWIFVGGEKGIAVLRTDGDGKGWETKKAGGGAIGLSQLKSTDFPVSIDGSPLHWKQLSLKIDGKESLTNIRKIVADEASGKVYVVTRDALLRITMNHADFAAGIIDDANCAVLFDLITGKIGQSNALNNLADGILKVQNYNDVNQAFALRKNFDQLFDMILIKSDRTAGNEKSIITLATSQGVIVSNEFKDTFVNAADIIFKVPKQANANANFDLGPALRFDFISNERGGKFFPNQKNPEINQMLGNLYVTALDKDFKYVNVYRFNIYNGTMFAFKEPYKDGVNSTDFFYRIGKIDEDLAASLEFVGPLDFVATKDEFGNSEADLINAVPILPNPKLFLNAGKDDSMIDLGMKFIKGLNLGGMPVRDSASGALYIPGEFGVMVNE